MITGEQFDTKLLRQAFGSFPCGVTAFCGMLDGRPEGMAVSSFTSVSLDPALVSVCMSSTSSTWPKLAKLPRLGLSVLGRDHSAAARALAAKGIDRFAAIDWLATPDGAVLVRGAILWLDCSIVDQVAAGDHEIVVLEVNALEIHPAEPLVYHRSKFFDLQPSA